MLLVVIGGQPEENVFRRKGSTFMRKKTRKFCAITLAAVMATTYMPYFPQGVVDLSYTAKAAQVTSGNFKYETNGASSISITGYTGTEGVVTIPNEIDGYKVTQIAKEAFKENEIITSVTIPDSVTIINDSAFYSCTKLESVTMGNSVKELGSYAFSNCTKLSSVKLSSVLTTVNSAAFYKCTALESISLPA